MSKTNHLHIMFDKQIKAGAHFSDDRKYRYTLWRIWDVHKPICAFIGLNPSTADEVKNDPTVTRCIRYAARWGYGGLCMLNIFAYRATNPNEMKAVEDPVGDQNNSWLQTICENVELVVAAWGAHGAHMNRANSVMECALSYVQDKIMCLGKTKAGMPRHPLYLKNDVKLFPLNWGQYEREFIRNKIIESGRNTSESDER